MDIGAPPDEFNASGQNWALPPLHPGALTAHEFAPFIETLRASMRHAGGLRLDHVMGLFRLYWIPRDVAADQGVYVRYPAATLLDILAVESERAGAFVIGEDLGTVQPAVREELARRDVLSYRLLWFGDPESFPMRSLAAVTTHDLPTVAGLWSGSDLREQAERGLRLNEPATLRTLERVRASTQLDGDAPMPEVVLRVHQQLARAPSLLQAATLEDLCCVHERPNLPGTGRERDNWSLALPLSLESLISAPLPAQVCEGLARA
jgi:4-alpha-glucanotransferase